LTKIFTRHSDIGGFQKYFLIFLSLNLSHQTLYQLGRIKVKETTHLELIRHFGKFKKPKQIAYLWYILTTFVRLP
jgi:hypothetical protein